jgi:hypothetical protein
MFHVLWSHQEFAKLNLNKEWLNFKIIEISLEIIREDLSFYFGK